MNSCVRPSASRASRRSVVVQASSARRSVLITGANTGIGFETAKALLAKNFDVILGCRDEHKGKAALNKLMDLAPGASCELAVFDLADLDTVSDYTKALLDSGRRLDVLINNAGVMACPLARTKQGFEMQIGVNHLGHFLLTEELLPRIKEAGAEHADARIVNLASSANYGGTIDFDDLNWDKKGYQKWPAYCQSKLANVMYSYELDRRLPASEGITVNAVHPGVVATELGRYLFPSMNNQGSEMSFVEKIIAKLATTVLLTPERGAEASIFVASSPEASGVSGKYFDSVSLSPKQSKKESYDVQRQDRLTQLSKELVYEKVPTRA
jgi:NAD(P)-dependent dehydrogenase (short-subunit alcohol dehydrogenase family)